MTEVMISIKPKWVDLILKLQKRWELRKTVPKATVPFKCYIYMTEGIGVIGEFTCDQIEQAAGVWIDKEWLKDSCVPVNEAREYAGIGILYKWRIRSLITYPEPKPLCMFGLDRPPQSWCYVKGGDPDAADGSGEADRNL